MEMNMDESRKQFEEWYLNNWKENAPWAANMTIDDVICERNDKGGYRPGGYMQGCWDGWKAAIAAGIKVKE